MNYQTNPPDERDQQIISLLIEGKTQKEIAADLYMSRATVRERICLLIKKYECKNALSLTHKFPKIPTKVYAI